MTGGRRRQRRAAPASRLLRVTGALALLAMAALHLQQFRGAHYSDVPTIGTLFALNFAGGTAIGLGLLAPVERLGRRFGPALVTVLALAGLAMAASSIVFLLISESHPLFGFRETGYRSAVVVALVSEGIATLSLAVFLARELSPGSPGA